VGLFVALNIVLLTADCMAFTKRAAHVGGGCLQPRHCTLLVEGMPAGEDLELAVAKAAVSGQAYLTFIFASPVLAAHRFKRQDLFLNDRIYADQG